jgi:hypothetical protein
MTSDFINDVCVKLDLNQDLEIKPSFFFLRTMINDSLEYAMTQSIGNKTKSFFDLLNKIFVGSEI